MVKNIMSVFGSTARTEEATETSSAADGNPGGAAPGSVAAGERTVMILGKTVAFKGELWADEDLILLGRMEGTITHTSAITVGVGGTVIGNIEARFVTVKGTVEGNIEATELVVLSPTACVFGNIAAPRIGIVEGASFSGSVRMTVVPTVAVVPEVALPPVTTAPTPVLEAKAVDRILQKH
jgi:cytoskeletal protein CcmA (bactofilin family)